MFLRFRSRWFSSSRWRGESGFGGFRFFQARIAARLFARRCSESKGWGFSTSCTLCLKVLPTVLNGGDSGTRTRNLGIANAALSQLSYTPTRWPIAARSNDHMFIVANRSVGCQGDATAGWLSVFPVTGLARRAPGDCCCRRCKWNHRRRCRIRGGGRGRRRWRRRRRHGRQAVRRRW